VSVKIQNYFFTAALLIIGILVATAIPRFRAASRGGGAGPARVLAEFGADVGDSTGGVAVSCASCGPADLPLR